MVFINKQHFRKYAPHWLVFGIDLFICFISINLSFFVINNFYLSNLTVTQIFSQSIPFLLLLRIMTFYFFKTYAGLIRYTSAKDTEKIFLVTTTGSVLISIINISKFYLFDSSFLVPFSIIIIDFFITTFFLTAFRLTIKTIYHNVINPSKNRSNVLIYGADEFGATTKRTLDRDAGTRFKVVAYIDKNREMVGSKLNGLTIYNPDKLEYIIKRYNITHLIISKKIVNVSIRSEIIDKCLKANVQVLSVPDSEKWINGELSYNQIKSIKIEDLLERAPIKLDSNAIQKDILNRVVLITGAAGSIGSEIVRQVTRFFPKKIIIFDQAESPLYDLELEIREEFKFFDFAVEIGSVTSHYRMQKIFEKYKPDIIYHAAAYKHVPMMENNPTEAVNTNVWGTKNLADLAVQFGVEKFVMISTDKAVNPTNVMGASKRIAEMYIQSLTYLRKTTFVTTRFGNVLGSNGSVIPRFRKQIESGGPVTITHPEITRFFMTIPEACQLVLEAGTMGKGGEIFLFDMGKSVKILDLAKKMIKLYGLQLGKDIHIKFTGLRPGEKLYEELLCDLENTIHTHHPKIMIAKTAVLYPEHIQNQIKDLIELIVNNDKFEIVKKMKEIVPEFVSQNSIFEKLNKQLVAEIA